MSKHLYELNGWINREGKIFYCPPNYHKQKAEELKSTEYNLEKMGWVKIYNGYFLMSDKCSLRPASHQCAKILDLCIECNNTNRWEEFYNKYANK
jgi:hypothetical protein